MFRKHCVSRHMTDFCDMKIVYEYFKEDKGTPKHVDTYSRQLA